MLFCMPTKRQAEIWCRKMKLATTMKERLMKEGLDEINASCRAFYKVFNRSKP